ncbi:hypothetical protein MNBD_GAMMA08-255 [hydrothermal vent metagenome]|uniref:Endonuclease GajA/Old nuclease/RecF-like AAA domain-containing protein n=1 Tax=hydrothermal vent metagenome TaxID=652676 RepID=A0A3B0XFS7_9ZZZZ
MENLQVRNFLVIKSANFEVGQINLIIGSQANGKSVLAKLLYYFRDFLNTTYLESIKNFEVKKDLEKKALQEFEKYFPKYTWSNQEFTIEYSIDDFVISITRKRNKSGQAILKFNYSNNLISLHKKLKNCYKKQRDKKSEHYGSSFHDDAYYTVIEKYVFEGNFSSCFNRSLFIPASRSFFANLQKNVFSFLASNIEIDPFINEFGSQYEHAKRLSQDSFFNERSNKNIMKKINLIVESILVGKYKYEDDQDWIENKGKKINLTKASSGQQEALPMLLVMSVWSMIMNGKRDLTMFIEEPEAHLFPVSQKHIVSLLGLIHNKAQHNFVITTHSPYILTAINNMVLANDISNELGKEKIKDIVDPDFTIAYEAIKAYTIQDGVLVSILDDEARLIGENIIDSVSDEFSMVFDDLINLQVGIK